MIKINYLWPWEKKRIKQKVTEEIEEEYNQKVKNITWNHTGNEIASLYVYLKDGKQLYIRFDIDWFEIKTISEDMEF